MSDRFPLIVFGRLLTCTRCGARVDLIEIDLTSRRQTHWIDEHTYVCGPCLEPVAPSLRSAA